VASDAGPLLSRIHDFLRRMDATLGVNRAFLFGSTVKGNRLKESDVDLIVVSKAFTGMSMPERLGMLQKEWNYNEELQALAYTPEEFSKVSQRLTIKEILSYAIELRPQSQANSNKGN
jgi:predicted nucleotidyltransferase